MLQWWCFQTLNHLLKCVVELAASMSSHTSLPATWKSSQLLTRCYIKETVTSSSPCGSSRRETTIGRISHTHVARTQVRKIEWAEKDRGGKKEENWRRKKEAREEIKCVCESETSCFCLLSGRECILFFLALTYQSGPPGREQNSVGWRGVS